MRSRAGKTGIALLFCLVSSLVWAVSPADSYPRLEPSLELDQMLSIRFGAEYRTSERVGIRGSLGISPLGFPLISCSAAGVYHFRLPEKVFQVDAEAGLLLGYANFFEGEQLDLDPVIDNPFAGWLYGAAVSWGYRRNGCQLSLLSGAALWWEWQRDSGWKGPEVMPVVGLRWGWHL